MNPIVKVGLEGIPEAVRMMQGIDRLARRRVGSAAVRAGNAVLVKEAKRRAPTETGTLRRQIRHSTKQDRKRNRIVGRIRPKRSRGDEKKNRRDASRYIHLVTGGTKPHVIEAEKDSGLRIGGKYYTRIEHPGTMANPFVQEAAERAFVPAVKAFREKLFEKLHAELAKLGRR